jgi:hypothetical protein
VEAGGNAGYYPFAGGLQKHAKIALELDGGYALKA